MSNIVSIDRVINYWIFFCVSISVTGLDCRSSGHKEESRVDISNLISGSWKVDQLKMDSLDIIDCYMTRNFIFQDSSFTFMHARKNCLQFFILNSSGIFSIRKPNPKFPFKSEINFRTKIGVLDGEHHVALYRQGNSLDVVAIIESEHLYLRMHDQGSLLLRDISELPLLVE